MKEEPKDSEREQKDNNKENIKSICFGIVGIVCFIIIYIVLSCILTFFITKITHYFIFDSQQLIVILNIVSIVIALLPLLILTIQKVSVGGFSLELKQKKKEVEDKFQELRNYVTEREKELQSNFDEKKKELEQNVQLLSSELVTIGEKMRRQSIIILSQMLLYPIKDEAKNHSINAVEFEKYCVNNLSYLYIIFFSVIEENNDNQVFFAREVLSCLINFLVSGYIIDLLYYIFYNHQYTISKSQEDAIKIFQNIFYLIHNPITNDNSYSIAKFTVCPTSIDSFLNCIFENEQIPTPQMREEMKCLLTEYIHLIQKYQEYQNNPLTWIEQFKDKNIQIVV